MSKKEHIIGIVIFLLLFAVCIFKIANCQERPRQAEPARPKERPRNINAHNPYVIRGKADTIKAWILLSEQDEYARFVDGYIILKPFSLGKINTEYLTRHYQPIPDSIVWDYKIKNWSD